MCSSDRPKVVALVPAAGSSRRMGHALPKVLIELHGKTILEHTVTRLLASPLLDKVIVLAPHHLVDRISSLPLGPRVAVTQGGETRKLSVGAGLSYISQHEADTDIVLVHDGARCCVSPDLVTTCIEQAVEHGAVTAAIPAVDSLKEVRDDGLVVRSLNREAIRAIQTPQVFTRNLLVEAHERGDREATDDASLVEALHPVYVVQGEQRNLKVTTPFDLKLAQLLLEEEAPTPASS